MNKFNIGEEVYFINPHGDIYIGKIIEFIDKYKRYRIRLRNGESYYPLEDKIAKTYEDVLSIVRNETEKIQNEYRNRIKNINDLIIFMLKENISLAEEYTDWNAREVAIEKAKEFGFDVDDF